MQVKNLWKSCLTALAISSIFLSTTMPVKADAGDPNGEKNTPEKGWTLWQRWDKLREANLDFGSDAQLQKACFGEIAPVNVTRRKLETYWYRVSSNLDQTGSGTIQYGCWENGQFKSTVTVDISVTQSTQSVARGSRCRQVQTPKQFDGLAIRSQPNFEASRVGGVGNGELVTLTTDPPTVLTVKDTNWLEVETPVRGWINNGSPGTTGNVVLCK
jgi:hypothetical protein